MPADQPRYLRRNEIDDEQWNRCIDNAPNGLVYAYSFYLDNMSKQWDALILGNYEAVMPLTWNKKYGISYLYQPAFVAAGGVFGDKLSEAVTTRFISAIPKKFRLIEVSLNPGNELSASLHGVLTRQNYVLNLNRSYDQIYSGYRENVKRNIKKSRQYGCRFEKDVPADAVLALSRTQMSAVSNLNETDYENIRKLYDFLYSKKMAMSYGVYDSKNNLVASAIYFFSHTRSYYIVVGNHPNGKTLGASHYLIDRFIFENANSNLLLDFEGSDIQSLAFFYSSFGAHLETYPALRINRLPFFIKWMK